MTDYRVKFTDKSKAPIVINETSIDNSNTDLSLPGRKKLEYGRDMNANFLHLLENFACPEDELLPGNPDLAKASFQGDTTKKLLSAPVEGQLWYNITQETLFVWTNDSWVALGMSGDIAANWGIIAHGSSIPRPKNKHGYTFKYDECAWIVSPFVLDGAFRYMKCMTDDQAKVTMTYTPEDPNANPVEGCANYMIVGIKGNVNLGKNLPVPDPTPIPSPTPTVTPSVTRSAEPSPTPSITPTPGVTPTPTPSNTPSNTPLPSVTPTATPITYSTNIVSTPNGLVTPGELICYGITLSHPAPVTGYQFTLTRSGDFNNVCTSTNGETNGPIIDTYPMSIPSGQTYAQICLNAPAPATPPPTPTATPRYACKIVHPDNNVWGATYWHGFMCATNNGGALDYFTNASSGNGNYYPCTQWTACNNATSFSSTQTIANDPVRGNQRYYQATPAVHLVLAVELPGIGRSNNADIYLFGTTPQERAVQINIGNRAFTVTLTMNPVLISQSGSNKTWRVDSSYVVSDNETGLVSGFCNV